MSALIFDPARDFVAIPYLPLNPDEEAELRFQLRSTGAGSRAEYSLRADGCREPIAEGSLDVPAGGFGFFRVKRVFSAGEHKLTLCWRTAGEAEQTREIPVSVFPKKEARLTGGYVMLAHGASTGGSRKTYEDEWVRFVTMTKRMGIDLLIVFVTVQEIAPGHRVAHYPSRLFPRSEDDVSDGIAVILREAEKNGQKVMLGLGGPLEGTLTNMAQVMEELYSLYGASSAFYGWYSSYEVNLALPDEKQNWLDWQEMRRIADRLNPVSPIMISPWVETGENTGIVHPSFLERLRLGNAGFDILMPQDMMGHTIPRGRLNCAESDRIFSSLTGPCAEGDVHLWANVESFDFDRPGKQLVPKYVAGDLFAPEGFVDQMKTAAPYAEKVLTFMLTGLFASPDMEFQMGEPGAAVRQYEDYVKYLRKL